MHRLSDVLCFYPGQSVVRDTFGFSFCQRPYGGAHGGRHGGGQDHYQTGR